MYKKKTSVAFFVHEYPTWITDEINILRKEGIKVQVFSFIEKSIFHRNIINNNLKPIFIKLAENNNYKLLLRFFGNFIKSPFLFIKLSIVTIFILKKKVYPWKSLIKTIPSILEASRKLDKNTQFIHAHFANETGFFAAIISKILKRPFSVTAHAGDIYLPNPKLKFVLNSASLICTISQYNMDYLVTNEGINKEKLYLSYLGIPTPKKNKYRLKLNSINPIKIGCLAFFVEKKGISDLINAINLLINKKIKVTLLLGGEGPLKEKLMRLVNFLNIKSNILFKDFIDISDRNDFFNEIDIFCLPSITDSRGGKEGIPVVLMEAMAFGVPMISTRHSGIPELVIDNYTGMLVDEHNPEQIAKKIEYCLENPKILKKLSKKGC